VEGVDWGLGRMKEKVSVVIMGQMIDWVREFG